MNVTIKELSPKEAKLLGDVIEPEEWSWDAGGSATIDFVLNPTDVLIVDDPDIVIRRNGAEVEINRHAFNEVIII